MKILYVCADSGVPVLGRKGASVHVREMIEALGRAGHNVLLVAQTLQKSNWEKPADLSATVMQVKPSAETLATVRAIKEFGARLTSDTSLGSDVRRIAYNRDLETDLLRRFDSDSPDLIYERASLYGIAGGIVARALRRPQIVELNAPLATEQSAYRDTLFPKLAAEAERATLERASAIFVVSETLREHVLSLGIDSGKIHVVPNGIDSRRFSSGPRNAELRGKLGISDAQVIGFVGGLRPWHGVEALPTLLERVVAVHPSTKMVIVGSGPLLGDLKKEFAKRNLIDRAIFPGAIAHDEVALLLREFDIALAPYPEHAHAFYFSPLKLFEYLSCGVATVAADVGQIREIVTHRQNGWLYPPGDFEALFDACNSLLGDPSLRQILGEAGARLVHEHYTWDHNVRRVEMVFRQLTAPKGE